MLDGLLAISSVLLLRHSLIELLHGEGLSPPLPFHVGSDLWRELGGQVRRLIASQPLLECLERGTDGLLGVLVGVEFGEVSDLGDKLLTFHEVPLYLLDGWCAVILHLPGGYDVPPRLLGRH